MELVDEKDFVGQDTSLGLFDDIPRIVYFDATNIDLKIAYKELNTWKIKTIATAGAVGFYPSIQVLGKSQIGISYYDFSNTCLKYFSNSLSD
jgi:hypothetical protein